MEKINNEEFIRDINELITTTENIDRASKEVKEVINTIKKRGGLKLISKAVINNRVG